jgi:hypothetical protein
MKSRNPEDNVGSVVSEISEASSTLSALVFMEGTVSALQLSLAIGLGSFNRYQHARGLPLY